MGGKILTLEDELINILGEENVKTSEIDCLCYSRDMSVHFGKPDVVVFPTTKDQVVKIVELANRGIEGYKSKIPITPRGSGTSVTGAVIPTQGGIVIDFTKMNKIIEVNIKDGYAVVQPGVICGDLNKELSEEGYFFPPDPGSSSVCTIGGMVSTNASGLRAVKYGTTKNHILGLEVVLTDSRVLKTGTRAPKTSAGYDLTRLFINSEGTLGLVTEITIKISPLPEHTAMVLAYFEKIEDLGNAASKILMSGIELSACEVMDKISIDVVNEAMDLDLPDIEGMLVMEVDGFKEAVNTQIKRIVDICNDPAHKALEVKSTDNKLERLKLWKARAGLVSALSRYESGYRLIPIAEDFGVPVSKIPDAINEAHAISKKHDIIIATFGHIGDGNTHTTFIMDVRKPQEWDKVRVVGQELIELALKLGGTISAEHGTGIAKAPYIEREIGLGLEIMKKIKKTLDPNNIMNPGKMGLTDEKTDIYDYFAFSELQDHPENVKSFGKDIDDEILICVQCGFCRAGCPTFNETTLESLNARGRVLLCYGLLSGQIEPNQEVADKIYQCTTCMNCTTTCPSGIEVVKIIERVRQFLVEKGFIIPNHSKIADNIASSHNPFGESTNAREDLVDLASNIDQGGDSSE
jgi:glycolate oxidase